MSDMVFLCISGRARTEAASTLGFFWYNWKSCSSANVYFVRYASLLSLKRVEKRRISIFILVVKPSDTFLSIASTKHFLAVVQRHYDLEVSLEIHLIA